MRWKIIKYAACHYGGNVVASSHSGLRKSVTQAPRRAVWATAHICLVVGDKYKRMEEQSSRDGCFFLFSFF